MVARNLQQHGLPSSAAVNEQPGAWPPRKGNRSWGCFRIRRRRLPTALYILCCDGFTRTPSPSPTRTPTPTIVPHAHLQSTSSPPPPPPLLQLNLLERPGNLTCLPTSNSTDLTTGHPVQDPRPPKPQAPRPHGSSGTASDQQLPLGQRHWIAPRPGLTATLPGRLHCLLRYQVRSTSCRRFLHCGASRRLRLRMLARSLLRTSLPLSPLGTTPHAHHADTTRSCPIFGNIKSRHSPCLVSSRKSSPASLSSHPAPSLHSSPSLSRTQTFCFSFGLFILPRV